MERAASQISTQLTKAQAFGCGVVPRFQARISGKAARLQHPKQKLLVKAVATFEPSTELNLEDDVESQSLYQRFEELLKQYDFNFKNGDKVIGTVFRIDGRGAYVDIGAKSPAICPVSEASLAEVDRVNKVLRSDEAREFIIIREYPEVILSLKRLEYAVAWQRVRQLQEEDVVVYGKVVSVNRGGLMVEVEHLRGFVPTSHLSAKSQSEDLTGQMLALKFLEVDEERFRLVLSNRRATTESSTSGLKVGDVVEGVVQAVKPYGAFVDLGSGMNGLLHISQISHDRISSVESVLSEGDKLKVMVLSQDRDKGRVALSTKKLEPTPGDMLRDPALVFERAEEMAALFRERVAAAEAAATAEEARVAEAV